ncbi:tetratricopeptide repeat protein 19, mitochondrial-like [Ptychodera flava]|uniref:tetratricopeptide repeat protein 19, mitochondrial-like n=1 Tax=Ptychodera flava TaxID=63121 RepID=UPI00396A1DA7
MAAAGMRTSVYAQYLVINLQKRGFTRQIITARTQSRCVHCSGAFKFGPRSSPSQFRQPSPYASPALWSSSRLCSSRQGPDNRARRKALEDYLEYDNKVLNALYVGCFGFLLFLTWIAYEYKFKPSKVNTLEKLVAEAIIADRHGRPVDAERIYHRALLKAQQENNKEGIVYVYDQMANLAMKRGHFHKSEELFKESLRGLLSSGFPKDDNAVIEISLKLAQVYTNRHRHVEATAGYKWCIETTEKKIAEMPPEDVDKNTESLLGLCWNTYAHYLLTRGQLSESEGAFRKALTLCENQLTVDGMNTHRLNYDFLVSCQGRDSGTVTSPLPLRRGFQKQSREKTVTLLNDLGTVCDMQGRFDEAYEYLEKAIALAQEVSKADVPRLLCNAGSIQMHRGNFKEAEECFSAAMAMAEKKKDMDTIRNVKEGLKILETTLAKQIS